LTTESAESYYRINHELSFEHGYSLSEIERMLPFERDVYIMMINEKLAEREKNRQS